MLALFSAIFDLEPTLLIIFIVLLTWGTVFAPFTEYVWSAWVMFLSVVISLFVLYSHLRDCHKGSRQVDSQSQPPYAQVSVIDETSNEEPTPTEKAS
jgi:hypothetical protein